MRATPRARPVKLSVAGNRTLRLTRSATSPVQPPRGWCRPYRTDAPTHHFPRSIVLDGTAVNRSKPQDHHRQTIELSKTRDGVAGTLSSIFYLPSYLTTSSDPIFTVLPSEDSPKPTGRSETRRERQRDGDQHARLRGCLALARKAKHERMCAQQREGSGARHPSAGGRCARAGKVVTF
jgi:hypothetical protein